MKVAVCISGIIKLGNKRGNLQKYNQRIKEKFPDADFYYATWSNFTDAFNENYPNETGYFYEEPEIPYHPYIDLKPEDAVSHHFVPRIDWAKSLSSEKKAWTSHHTKQLLIHAYLLKQIPEYDVIVRARFDSFINKKADFAPYVKDTYDTGKVHGFAVTRANMFNEFYDSPMARGSKHESYLLDQLIIHRYDTFDPDNVLELHEQNKLHPAEWGWYQTLSYPGVNHKNHHGYINHDKNVLEKFMREHL